VLRTVAVVPNTAPARGKVRVGETGSATALDKDAVGDAVGDGVEPSSKGRDCGVLNPSSTTTVLEPSRCISLNCLRLSIAGLSER